MKIILIFIIMSYCTAAISAIDFASENCNPEPQNELKIYMEDLAWAQTYAEMKQKFDTIYQSGKRLEHRAYLVGNQVHIPVKDGTTVLVKDYFINSVRKHIESALQRQYADYIFFSDMGHSHLFIDKKLYLEKISKIDNYDIKAKYEIMLNDKHTKFLYHTAEQLKMLDENSKVSSRRELQWRFYTRNIVGDNNVSDYVEVIYNKDHVKNNADLETYIKDKEKYRYWGGGYNISASKNGCFKYINNGEELYFDISLYDVGYSSYTDEADTP